jgi:hypothetical protein
MAGPLGEFIEGNEGLAESQERVNKQMAMGEKQYAKTSKELGKQATALEKLENNVQKLSAGMKGLSTQFSGFIDQLGGFANVLAGAFGGVALKSAGEYNKQLFDLSRTAQATNRSFSQFKKSLTAIEEGTLLSKNEAAEFFSVVDKGSKGVFLTSEAMSELAVTISKEFGPSLEDMKQGFQELSGVLEKDIFFLRRFGKATPIREMQSYITTMMASNKMTYEQAQALMRVQKQRMLGTASMSAEENKQRQYVDTLQKLKRGFQDLIIAIGQPLTEVFAQLAGPLGDFASKVGKIISQSKNLGSMIGGIAKVSAFMAVGGAIAGMLAKVIGAVSAVAAVIKGGLQKVWVTRDTSGVGGRGAGAGAGGRGKGKGGRAGGLFGGGIKGRLLKGGGIAAAGLALGGLGEGIGGPAGGAAKMAGGVATGAGIGMMAGPWGAAIGGAIGGLVGLASISEETAKKMGMSASSAKALRDAQKSLSESMKGAWDTIKGPLSEFGVALLEVASVAVSAAAGLVSFAGKAAKWAGGKINKAVGAEGATAGDWAEAAWEGTKHLVGTIATAGQGRSFKDVQAERQLAKIDAQMEAQRAEKARLRLEKAGGSTKGFSEVYAKETGGAAAGEIGKFFRMFKGEFQNQTLEQVRGNEKQSEQLATLIGKAKGMEARGIDVSSPAQTVATLMRESIMKELAKKDVTGDEAARETARILAEGGGGIFERARKSAMGTDVVQAQMGGITDPKDLAALQKGVSGQFLGTEMITRELHEQLKTLDQMKSEIDAITSGQETSAQFAMEWNLNVGQAQAHYDQMIKSIDVALPRQKEMTKQTIETAKAQLKIAQRQLESADGAKEIAKAEASIMQANTTIAQQGAKLVELDRQRLEAVKKRIESVKVEKDIIQAQVDVLQGQLGLAESMYAGMGPMLAIQGGLIEKYREQVAILEKQKRMWAEAEGVPLEKKQLEMNKLHAEQLRLQKQQVDQARGLRDQYIDAITAFDQVEGKFSKFVIKRETGFGKALRDFKLKGGLKAGGIGQEGKELGLEGPGFQFKSGGGIEYQKPQELMKFWTDAYQQGGFAPQGFVMPSIPFTSLMGGAASITEKGMGGGPGLPTIPSAQGSVGPKNWGRAGAGGGRNDVEAYKQAEKAAKVPGEMLTELIAIRKLLEQGITVTGAQGPAAAAKAKGKGADAEEKNTEQKDKQKKLEEDITRLKGKQKDIQGGTNTEVTEQQKKTNNYIVQTRGLITAQMAALAKIDPSELGADTGAAVKKILDGVEESFTGITKKETESKKKAIEQEGKKREEVTAKTVDKEKKIQSKIMYGGKDVAAKFKEKEKGVHAKGRNIKGARLISAEAAGSEAAAAHYNRTAGLTREKGIYNEHGMKISGYTRGGKIPGYGGGDTQPILAERGEFIVNKRAAAAYGPLLTGINSFAEGGMVGGPVIPSPGAAGGAQIGSLINIGEISGNLPDMPRKVAQHVAAAFEELNNGNSMSDRGHDFNAWNP